MSDNLPMNNGIVVNASPLITLFKSGWHLCYRNCQRIVVPESVWQEISVCKDAAFRGLSEADWARRFGLIPSLRIALLQVRSAGLYIMDDLFDSLVAGEK